jgi:hypothetical protein
MHLYRGEWNQGVAMSVSTRLPQVDMEIPPLVGILLTVLLTIGLAALMGTFVLI